MPQTVLALKAVLLRDRSWKIRNAAVTALITLGEPAAAMVEPLAEDEDRAVRVAAVQVLEGIGRLTAP